MKLTSNLSKSLLLSLAVVCSASLRASIFSAKSFTISNINNESKRDASIAHVIGDSLVGSLGRAIPAGAVISANISVADATYALLFIDKEEQEKFMDGKMLCTFTPRDWYEIKHVGNEIVLKRLVNEDKNLPVSEAPYVSKVHYNALAKLVIIIADKDAKPFLLVN